MANPTDGEILDNQRYRFVVVRLVVDEHDQLVRGAVVDGAGTAHRHFVEWDGLLPAIQGWLTTEAPRGGLGTATNLFDGGSSLSAPA